MNVDPIASKRFGLQDQSNQDKVGPLWTRMLDLCRLARHPERRLRKTRSARTMSKAVLLVAAFLGLLVLAGSASARSLARVSLRAPMTARDFSLVMFSGDVRGGRPGAAVEVQRLVGKRWRAVVRGRTSAHGRFELTWILQLKRRAPVRVRVALLRGGRVLAVSSSRKIRILKTPPGPNPRPSANTQVLAPSVVSSVPAPGQSGTLRYSGGNDTKPGQIIAIGVGPATPDGFLGRVTQITTAGSQTVASTQPASLLDAVPSGSLDVVLKSNSANAARASARAASSAFKCDGSVGADVTPNVLFNASLQLEGSWKFLSLESASLTANASADASLEAALRTAGSCKLSKTTVTQFNGPAGTIFVGPVPIVLTSKISVYLDAAANAQASVSSSVSTGFSASAGIGWTKNGGFYPIQSFSRHFSSTPPQLSSSGSISANLTPTVDVLIDGVAGPEIAFKAGLALDADISKNPWWTLTAPVDLTASLAIPALNLSSPMLHVYQDTFQLKDAGGPFNAEPPPNFFLRDSNTTGNADIIAALGNPGDVPIVGDWTGQGKDTIGVYRPSNQTFYLRNSNTTGNADIIAALGDLGDVPIVGDWAGQGKDTIGVYRPGLGRFYLRNSNTTGNADIIAALGDLGDVPIVGDWTGQGKDTIGVYRPGLGRFYLRNSNTTGNADIIAALGNLRDVPIVGDWTGQHMTTIGVYR